MSEEPKTDTCCDPARAEEPTPEPCSPPKAKPVPDQSCCGPEKEQKATSSCCPPPEPSTESCCPPSSDQCCPPTTDDSSCCAPDPNAERRNWERPGYQLWPFVSGWIETPAGNVPQVSTRLSRTDRFGHWAMRWGIGRDRYRISPGLYAVGSPNGDSPVIVTANYKMTFDLVRCDLAGRSVWILVLETFGINVWCAAGKGTFGTEELVRRVEATELGARLNHRRLIVPQLGAVGIAAHEVTKNTGFRVIYGPVRCSDLPYFLDHDFEATTQMRRVTFGTWERLLLTPVELTGSRKIIGWSVLILFLLGGIGNGGLFSFGAMLQRGGAALIALFMAILAGAVITPTLLPWLPGRLFAVKGAITGGVLALAGAALWGSHLGTANTLALLLSIPAVSAWMAMNFTGSSTFTSPTGVEKEMRQTIPYQAAALILAGICWITAAF